MSAARLILKQPTGWFAAGREVAQALALLSGGAFKLYMHLCLEAERHSGRVAIETAEWARILRKDPAAMEANMGEFQSQGICEHDEDHVEICDRFWPYQKQVAVVPGSLEADFLRQARTAFLAPACVRSAFSAADEKLALKLGRNGVTLEQLRRAIWLGCAAQIQDHVKRPIAAAHHQPGVLRIVNRGSQPARDPGHLLGACAPQNGANGKALVRNEHGAG